MNFLILFCRQNRTNQLILYQDIETIILYLQYDVGQIQLLIEMFKDNLKLLNTGYLQLTKKEDNQNIYKFQPIQYLVINKKVTSLKTKCRFLNLIMPNREYKEYELRILYCEGSTDKAIKFYLDDQFMNESQDLYTQLKSVDWKDTYRDEPFIYHAQLLDFLLQTCLIEPSIRQFDPQFRDIDLKDNFNISVFKIKKIIRAQYLLELLREPDQQVDVKMRQLQFTRIISFQQSVQQDTNFDASKGFNILKPKILEFLRLIHITSEKAPAADIPLGQLTRDVIHVIDFEIRKLVAVQNKANFTDDYFDYIVEYLLPFLLSYTERVLTSQNLEIKRSIENFSKEFAKTLEEFKSLLTDRYVDIIQQFRSKYPNDDYHISFQDVKRDIINNDQDQDIQLQSHQELDDRQPLLIKQKTKKKKTGDQVIDMSERQSLESLWDQFTNYFQKCPTVLDEIETERSTLANALTKIDQLITEPCEIKHSSDTILKKLINFVQSGILQPQNSGTIVILLKIMGKIIEKDPAQLKEQQKLFDNLGATQMVLNVLSDYSKTLGTNMILNLMKFLNVLLCQGNTKVQEAVYIFCKTQQKSENIFKVFADYLRSATLQIEVDEEDLDAMMQKDLVNVILKFLQNCAEGHYSELQNYIRYQSNSRASIDLINVVADLFKSQEKTIQSFSNLMRCLDTLNELVQGPCLENQVAVSDSKFFDVVQEMFPQRKKAGNEDRTQERRVTKKKSTKKTDSKKKKKLPLTKGMKAQLQNKILILILSLMEKREINSKNMILRRIMRSLPINTLEIHISKVYKKFNSLYQGNYIMKSFENINLDAEEDDDDDHPKMVNNEKQYSKKETVIQNGFYLMFLICYYIESGEALDSQLINYNKQYLKQQNKENNLFDPNSTIGQLYSLLLEIIEQSLEMSNKLLALKELAGLSNEEVIQQKAIQKANDKKRIVKKAFLFFRSKTAHVELIRDDQIELVFFPVLPYCRLQKEEKIDFQNNVDRSSVKAKVQDLMDRSSEFIEKMIHEENMRLIYQKYKLIGFFANYVQLWKDLAYYLTIILNLIVITSYAHETGDGNQLSDVQFFRDESYTLDQTKNIFFILGLVMTICSLFVVVFVLAKLAPLIVVKAYKKPDFFTGDVGLIKKLINLLYKPIFILLSCLADFTVLYYLGYGVLAILGTIVHPFFFCFHLSVVFLRFPTLRNVVRSVTEPRVSLLLTLLLIIIITYIYSLWAFIGLQKDYEQNCKSVLYCFLLIFEYNFQVPGGIGGQMTQNAPSPQYEPQRFIFDQTNNIILVIIMISIASGIIIDTFGQLREEENAMQSDINEKCFICGLENIRFERSSEGSGGFVGHIRLNHYMWNYLYYIAYLQSKSDQDYSGIESYVQKKRKEQDLSWVPFNRARELKKEDDDVEKEQKQVESINSQFDSMIESAKQLQIQLKLFKQRRAQGHKREDTNTQVNTYTQPTILDK
ncbi:hypothetical protein pb186bvf_018575 [Paramecium bursaria]